MFGVREFNVAIELWGVIFCFVGIVSSLLFTRADRRYRRLIVSLFLLGMYYAGGDAIAGIFRGQPGEFAWAATHVGNMIGFAAGIWLVATMTWYLCARIAEAGGPTHEAWCTIVSTAAVVATLLAAFGAFYSIDEQNLYSRTEWYWVVLAYSFVANGITTALLVRERKCLAPQAFTCMLIYSLAPVLSAIPQALIYGLNFSMITTVLALLALYFELQAHSAAVLVRNAETIARTRVELTESRLSAMVSRVHPKFFFEAIDGIQEVCTRDSARASQALELFSDCMRLYMDSMEQLDLIPIERELEHVSSYLELMRITHPNEIGYHITKPTAKVSVPPLSILTLAEYAVYRVLESGEEAATITVGMGEARSEHWISVVDNIDETKASPVLDDDVQSSIEDVRMHLDALCGGTLTTTSNAAMIHLPKK